LSFSTGTALLSKSTQKEKIFKKRGKNEIKK